MVPIALEMKNVTKRYGRRWALAGLDLRIPAGTVFGLVGSNGAGKTTALSIVGGVVRANGGTVDVLGRGPFDPARSAGEVSLMPQDAVLPGYARALDVMVFYAQLQGMDSASARTNAREVLEWVHLSDRADSSIRSLSHGMRRRVVIAQAFLGEPRLVLLDEPLSGLDPREVVNIRNILTESKGKQTIVVSSHNLHEIERICDHVGFIEKGKTVRQDAMEAVTRSRHSLTYVLESEAIPIEQLEAVLPDARFCAEETTAGSGDAASPGGRMLRCEYDGDRYAAHEVNARVLKCLLEAGTGVTEVHRGSELENVYLDAASSA